MRPPPEHPGSKRRFIAEYPGGTPVRNTGPRRGDVHALKTTHVTDGAEPCPPGPKNTPSTVENASANANPDCPWRVFYTLPRAEKKCETRLAQRHVEVFLPTCEVVRQWKDRKKKVVEPLFKNYIFARVDEQDRLRVLQTPGIVRCVSFGGAPAEVAAEEIAQLQIAQKDPSQLLRIDYPPPGIGEAVTVVEGPLRGLHGEVIEHRGQLYVVIRVAAIRQAVRVSVPAAWVQADPSLHDA